MKTAVIIFIILLTTGFIGYLRGGDSFHLARILPFCGGFKPGFYDAAAIILLLMIPWGLYRLRMRDKEPEE